MIPGWGLWRGFTTSCQELPFGREGRWTFTNVLPLEVGSGTPPCLVGNRPEARIGHVAAVLGDTMVVHGGRTAPDQALADVWALDLPISAGSRLAWRRLEPSAAPPAARHRHSAVVLHSEAQASLIIGDFNPACLARSALLTRSPGMGMVQSSGKCLEGLGLLVQGSSVIVFGGCALGRAFGDVWQLRIQAGQAKWEQLQTTGRQSTK